MTPDAAFAAAREALLTHATDLAAARAAFRWPVLDEFNWVDHWFEPFARGNAREALKIVTEAAPSHWRSTSSRGDRARWRATCAIAGSSAATSCS